MSIAAINDASFSITNLNEKAYELTIEFKDKQTLSSKKFVFFQENSQKVGRIYDVFTKNGKSFFDLKELFDEKDFQFLSHAQTQMKNFEEKGPLLAVLDLQDTHSHYLPCSDCEESIASSEKMVCEFFKPEKDELNQDEEIHKVHTFFQKTLPLDYIIYEGSLKMSLLKSGTFSDKEIEFLNSKKGSIAFCQCAEFFMNGFKFGQTAKNTSCEFKAEQFIKSTAKKEIPFQACSLSTVFYPSLYKKIYSPEGEFAQILSSVFSITGGFTKKTHITTLTMAKK